MLDSFDDIRPFVDAEIPSAMERIASSEQFPLIARYLFPSVGEEEVKALIRSIKTTTDFQWKFTARVVEAISAKTTTGRSCEGFENISPEYSYLFVSNHRDIVLDAMFLTYDLAMAGHRTPEITFGANLMQGQLVVDLGRANKMFKVERPDTVASSRDFLDSSRRLSSYIRHALLEKQESVWIAQRNGRTKDGDDRTDPGLAKMFSLSRQEDTIDCWTKLRIVPVAVSYEWEPCDILKVLEIDESSRHAYVKKPGEDLNSIITGITAPKGRVCLRLCKPISAEDLADYKLLTVNQQSRAIASLIDSRIHKAYRLYPNNYIAYDMLFGSSAYASSYSQAEKAAFEAHLGTLRKYSSESDFERLAELFLKLYANPVINSMA